MAKIKGNQVTAGMSGKFADQIVFKTRKGTRYAVGPPTPKHNRKPTPNQLKTQQKMKRCNRYAFHAIENIELKEAYAAVARGGQTAVNIAFRDAWRSPFVHDIIATSYKGNTGDIIFIHASDDFKVQNVLVTIADANGEFIEQGDAVQQGPIWLYVATTTHTHPAKITARAYDLPGNEALKELAI